MLDLTPVQIPLTFGKLICYKTLGNNILVDIKSLYDSAMWSDFTEDNTHHIIDYHLDGETLKLKLPKVRGFLVRGLITNESALLALNELSLAGSVASRFVLRYLNESSLTERYNFARNTI